MSFTLDIFKNLRSEYSTWDSLKAHFLGEGLQIKEEGALAIINYKHGSECMEATKWFRSVVWDKDAHIPLSVSSSRACSDENDIDNAFTWSKADKVVSEYLDGVTLNLFKQGDCVIVSSRTRLGAGAGFYNKTPFQQMLVDAVKGDGHETIQEFFEKNVDQTVAHPFLTVLIQHPEHRVVEKVEKACVYILHNGYVSDDGLVHINMSSTHSPKTYTLPAENEAITEWFEKLVNANSWSWRGVCIIDGHGNRWRIRSSVYKMIRSMRGNTSRSDERFFTLRAAGMVKTYLQYYPEESNLFWKYEKWMRSATKLLNGYYVAVYKSRELTLDGIDARWHTHLGAIHNMYMGQLKPSGNGVHMNHVVSYMNALPVPRLLFLMNLDKRLAGRGTVA